MLKYHRMLLKYNLKSADLSDWYYLGSNFRYGFYAGLAGKPGKVGNHSLIQIAVACGKDIKFYPCYFAGDLMQTKGQGLALNGDVPAWSLDAGQMQRLRRQCWQSVLFFSKGKPQVKLANNN